MPKKIAIVIFFNSICNEKLSFNMKNMQVSGACKGGGKKGQVPPPPSLPDPGAILLEISTVRLLVKGALWSTLFVLKIFFQRRGLHCMAYVRAVLQYD